MPDDGLGMSLGAIVGQFHGDPVTFAGELDGGQKDGVAIEVLCRHVVAAVQPAVIDGAAVVRRQVLALRRFDDVVLPRGEQQQRHVQLAVPGGLGLQTVIEQRQERAQRRSLVGALADVGIGDVAADPGHQVSAGGECLLDHRPDLGELWLGDGVDAHQAGHIGVLETGPQRERSAHAEPGDDDPPRPLGEALVGRLHLGRPIVPSRRLHVVDGRAVPRQPGQLDVETGAGDRLRQPSHGRRVAREAMEHEHAGGVRLGGAVWDQASAPAITVGCSFMERVSSSGRAAVPLALTDGSRSSGLAE